LSGKSIDENDHLQETEHDIVRNITYDNKQGMCEHGNGWLRMSKMVSFDMNVIKLRTSAIKECVTLEVRKLVS
jgi:hypothetical protein